MRKTLPILLSLSLVTLGSLARAQPITVDTINGYTVVSSAKEKLCFATIPLLSLTGTRVSFTLYQTKRGKFEQRVAYGEGRRPKKRKDRISLQFDGAEFYNRKVKMNREGVFELPHRSKKENRRFLEEFASKERMTILLRENTDGFALQLTRGGEVLTALDRCAKAL